MAQQYNFSDVFISYAREDQAYVERIVKAIADRHYEVWIDWEDIPQTADWWEEIKAGINASSTFVFVITEHSAQSEVCYREIQHAVDNNKRVVPMVPSTFDDDALQEKLHPTIRQHNWFVFEKPDYTFAQNIQRLVDTIDMDVDYLRTHSRYLVRASEWQARDRNDSFLLRGMDALEAERWLRTNHTREPRPTDLQVEFIDRCAAQRERDSELDENNRAVRFIDRRVLPAFFASWIMIYIYLQQSLPIAAPDITTRQLFESSLGIATTAGVLFALIALYVDEMSTLRYGHNRFMRGTTSSLYGFVLGCCVAGFLQVWHTFPGLDYVVIFLAWLGFTAGPILRVTFRLNAWLAFILHALSLYALFIFAGEAATAPWGRLNAIFYFTDRETMFTLGAGMALVISFGTFAYPLVMSTLEMLPDDLQITLRGLLNERSKPNTTS